ncbi:PEP-CTERM sorting domain-containing protein [Pseudomonadota bacterium]
MNKYIGLIVTLVIAIVLSASVNATAITHGNLTTDDTTNHITDTSNGRLYTRFDAFNLSYADTLTAIGAGGAFEGWSVATASIAEEFIAAALGSPTSLCSGPVYNHTLCGTIQGWHDGDFGGSYSTNVDYVAYLASPWGGTHIGLFSIDWAGQIVQSEGWAGSSLLDQYGGARDIPQAPINLLLYKEGTIPEPTTIALLGAGLFGISRRRRHKFYR